MITSDVNYRIKTRNFYSDRILGNCLTSFLNNSFCPFGRSIFDFCPVVRMFSYLSVAVKVILPVYRPAAEVVPGAEKLMYRLESGAAPAALVFVIARSKGTLDWRLLSCSLLLFEMLALP
jgi:hypothetical protein